MKKIRTRKGFRYKRIEKAWRKAKDEMEQTVEYKTHKRDYYNKENCKQPYNHLKPTYKILIESEGWKKFHAIDKIRRVLKKDKKEGILMMKEYFESQEFKKHKGPLSGEWVLVQSEPSLSATDIVCDTLYEFFRKLIKFFKKK